MISLTKGAARHLTKQVKISSSLIDGGKNYLSLIAVEDREISIFHKYEDKPRILIEGYLHSVKLPSVDKNKNIKREIKIISNQRNYKERKAGEMSLNQESIIHPLSPIYNAESRILILGTFPSVKSREKNFFYSHPQNRFWKVLAYLLEEHMPTMTKEKRALLIRHHIALWDVIRSCKIVGSSDSSIRDVSVNPIENLVQSSSIKQIFVNGKKAYELYNKYCIVHTGMKAELLPSTSSANASYTFDRLIEEWKKILPYLA